MDANKTPTGKNAKGVVSVEVFRGRLRLRFRYAGQRYSLALGLPDSKVNRLAAEQRANSIERDIACGRFDSSLASYKPESVLSVEPPDIESENIPSILELWEAYTQYKASSLKESTKGYHAILRKLFDRVSNVSVLDALQVKAGLEAVTTVHQTKRALMQLNAACKWGVKHGILNANPYEGMANEMPKYRYQLEPKPNAFSEEERDQVIQAFKNHKGTWNGRGLAGMGYAHYAPFVEFLFLTGCRPSEAIGLQWKHLTEDCSFIRFEGSITLAQGKPTRVKGSKNNKKRRFPCSERLQKLLLFIKPTDCHLEDQVFPSPKGKVINYNNFCNNAWNRVVDPIKAETTPYSCRDTFITTQIIKGIPESVIAEWCDTSVEMIQRYYADFLKMLSLRPID